MSKMNRFFAKVGRGVKKVGKKVGGTCDSAADSVRAKGLEIRIDEQYENLGRIVYRDLHTEENLEEEKLRTVAAIDALFDRITELKNAPAAKAEQAAADCEQPAAEEAAEEEAPAAEEATEEEAPAAEE